MFDTSYRERRDQLETYFDRTAADAWAKLTSDAPVSGVRATVRAGRDAMRATLIGWLPAPLAGARILDAGCGAGQLSMEAAARGAEVVGVDIAGTLVGLAAERARDQGLAGRIDFRVGDMLDPAHGRFDAVVAMDSLIHYRADDLVRMVEGLAARASGRVVFTVAPRTPLLTVMHAVGQLFPRGDRSPAIEPIGPAGLVRRLEASPRLADWRLGRQHRVTSGFYISHALELVHR